MGSRVLDVQAERSQSTSTYTKIYKDFFAKQFFSEWLIESKYPFLCKLPKETTPKN